MSEQPSKSCPENDQDTRLWQRVFNTSLPVKTLVPILASVGLLGPVIMGLVVYLAVPDQPWWYYTLESIGAGWLAPAFVSALLILAQSRLALVNHFQDRSAARQHTVAVSVFTSRLIHYQTLDVADPVKAAAFDVATYLKDETSPQTRHAWEAAAMQWYTVTGVPAGLHPPPRSLLKTMQEKRQQHTGHE